MKNQAKESGYKHIDTFLNTDKYAPVKELGFQAKHISNIANNFSSDAAITHILDALLSKHGAIKELGKRPPMLSVAERQQQVRLHGETIVSIMEVEAVGFSVTNIASILDKAGASAEEAITALTENADSLLTLTGPGKFSASNLSGMLSGAAPHMREVIRAVIENADSLLTLTGPGKFSASNLSSMLNGAALHMREAIRAVIENADSLLTLTGPGKFSASNLSNMLSGAKVHMREAIGDLMARKEVIEQLLQLPCYRGSSERLSGALSRSSACIGEKIDKLAQENGIRVEQHSLYPQKKGRKRASTVMAHDNADSNIPLPSVVLQAAGPGQGDSCPDFDRRILPDLAGQAAGFGRDNSLLNLDWCESPADRSLPKRIDSFDIFAELDVLDESDTLHPSPGKRVSNVVRDTSPSAKIMRVGSGLSF